jgi:DNA-damage-inducible protein D
MLLYETLLLERGIRPEELPASEDVKKVQRKLEKDEKNLLKDIKKGNDDKKE